VSLPHLVEDEIMKIEGTTDLDMMTETTVVVVGVVMTIGSDGIVVLLVERGMEEVEGEEIMIEDEAVQRGIVDLMTEMTAIDGLMTVSLPGMTVRGKESLEENLSLYGQLQEMITGHKHRMAPPANAMTTPKGGKRGPGDQSMVWKRERGGEGS
jgi:hypothetical protein